MINPPLSVLASTDTAQTIKNLGANPAFDYLTCNKILDIEVNNTKRLYRVKFDNGIVVSAFWHDRKNKRVHIPAGFIPIEVCLQQSIVSNLNRMLSDVRKARIFI